MKRIVTIQDISCVGKCSLTVALPIISAMGVEAAILPTAVLSTHTMFPNFTLKDLEDQIQPIGDHWKEQNIGFDAIYTGYLASAGQIELVKEFIGKFDNDNVVKFVDPAMADNGKLYFGFDDEFPKAMASLCGVADIIVPNLTEACLMTGMEYRPECHDESYIKELLGGLAALGTKKAVVLTGVTKDEGMNGVSGLNVETGEYFGFSHEKIDKSYHGTGDIFASATIGGIMRELPLEAALRVAARYTVDCIVETMTNDPEKTYGTDFEAVIENLLKYMKEA